MKGYVRGTQQEEVMTTPTPRLESNRDHLLPAIVDVLQSWPEKHRRIFTQAHYKGASPKDIARTMGLGVGDVEEVLVKCERALRAALRTFRDDRGYPLMGESRDTAMNWPQSHRDREDGRNELNSPMSLCFCVSVATSKED